MTKTYKISVCLIILLILQSCSPGKTSAPAEQLPEAYGIYAHTEKGLIRLPGQLITWVHGYGGWVCLGLGKPSNIECRSIDFFYIYNKDVNFKRLVLSKLEFKKKAIARHRFSPDADDIEMDNVNLWSATDNIEFDIIPIEEKRDMYRIKPQTKLLPGVYAFTWGDLNQSRSGFDDQKAYDITIMTN